MDSWLGRLHIFATSNTLTVSVRQTTTQVAWLRCIHQLMSHLHVHMHACAQKSCTSADLCTTWCGLHTIRVKKSQHNTTAATYQASCSMLAPYPIRGMHMYPVPPNKSQLAIGAAMAMNVKKLKGPWTIKAEKNNTSSSEDQCACWLTRMYLEYQTRCKPSSECLHLRIRGV